MDFDISQIVVNLRAAGINDSPNTQAFAFQHRRYAYDRDKKLEPLYIQVENLENTMEQRWLKMQSELDYYLKSEGLVPKNANLFYYIDGDSIFCSPKDFRV
jgi:hypothetical protein